MKRGFLSSSSKSSVPSSKAAPTPAASPTPRKTSPPPGWHSAPSDSPSTLHWSFLPSSPTPALSSPTATAALLLTAQSRSLLVARPPPALLSPPTDSPLYEIRKASPNKGLGVFATRSLPSNSLIFVDRPLLVYDASDRGPSRKEANAIFTYAISHLDPSLQRQFQDLTTAFAGSDTYLGRVETNGAPVISFEGAGDADPVTYTGIFPLFSRVNHACDANVRPEWDWERFELGLRTTRAVQAGEELCTTYIIPFQKRRERREELLVKWRFECQCSWCSLSDEENAKKDIEREQMAEAFLKQWHAQAGGV